MVKQTFTCQVSSGIVEDNYQIKNTYPYCVDESFFHQSPQFQHTYFINASSLGTNYQIKNTYFYCVDESVFEKSNSYLINDSKYSVS